MKPALVILRPEPGASRTQVLAEANGWQTAISPLFKIESLPWEAPDPDQFDALMITSANAAHYGGPALRRYSELPAYVVGEASEEAARNAGMNVAFVGSTGAGALADQLCADDHKAILHVAGDVTRPFCENALEITRIAVYSVVPIESQNLAEILAEPCVILLHSPRAAKRFKDWVTANALPREHLNIVAISDSALVAAGTGWMQAVAAAQPTDEAMLVTANSLR